MSRAAVVRQNQTHSVQRRQNEINHIVTFMEKSSWGPDWRRVLGGLTVAREVAQSVGL